MSHEILNTCIDACNECATECEYCAISCLHEKVVEPFAKSIELQRYCADMCRMTAAFLARSDEHTIAFVNKFCGLCAEICEACAEECEKHLHVGDCEKCAEACTSCAEECRRMELQHV